MEKKTPLYETHVKHGGKIVPFAGYLLPVQYQGVIAEHNAVRECAGLFDVSHMGEVLFEGKDALTNIQNLFTNDFSTMPVGKVHYSLMCNERGGVVDDLVVCKMAEDKYLVVINAANREKDVQWMQQHLIGEVCFSDVSDSYAQLAVQGPAAGDIIASMTGDVLPRKNYTFTENVSVEGIKCLVSRTGYTGEDGFELYCAPDKAEELYEKLLAAGNGKLVPCGLGARDTLRLEAAMPLYGHELTDDITPFEAGLGFFVKMDKTDFIGKKALENSTPARKRVGLCLIDRGIAREHEDIFYGDEKVGFTTSGTFCPYIKKAVAMAYLPTAIATVGNTVEIEVRGKRTRAEVTALPFYSRKNR